MLRLSLLGEQRLTRHGTDLVAGSRVVELRAYLVVHPGTQVPRAVLAGTFGPETSQSQAMTQLRRELHHLRLLLGGLEVLRVQQTFDPLFPAGLPWNWRADFVQEISDAAILLHATYGAALPTGYSTRHRYPIDRAAARVPGDGAAIAYLSGGWAGVIVGVDPDPAHAELLTAWSKS